MLPDTTATGDRLSVTFDENGNYFVNNDAMITTFDITTTNATLFIIDKVLEPVTEYIYDRLVAIPSGASSRSFSMQQDDRRC